MNLQNLFLNFFLFLKQIYLVWNQKHTLYRGGQNYFHKTKDKYTHNLTLLLVEFGINGKVI